MVNKCQICDNQVTDFIFGVKDYEYGVPGEWSYVKCDSCDVMQLCPFPDSYDDICLYYPKNYHKFSKSKLYRVLNDLILKIRVSRIKLPDVNDIGVIDIGAGDLRFLIALSEKFNIKKSIGIDLSYEESLKNNIHCTSEPFLKCSIESNFYHAVFMNNYLEHTLNPLEELKKAYSVLKPGGKIYGVLPNFDSWDRKIFGRYWGGMHTPRHLYHFTPSSLRNFLVLAAFSKIKIKNEIQPGHISISINNYILEKLSLKGPRVPFMSLLTLLMLPFSTLFLLFSKNGAMSFEAEK
jgi:SAM-dependent methyltransferase